MKTKLRNPQATPTTPQKVSKIDIMLLFVAGVGFGYGIVTAVMDKPKT